MTGMTETSNETRKWENCKINSGNSSARPNQIPKNSDERERYDCEGLKSYKKYKTSQEIVNIVDSTYSLIQDDPHKMVQVIYLENM